MMMTGAPAISVEGLGRKYRSGLKTISKRADPFCVCTEYDCIVLGFPVNRG